MLAEPQEKTIRSIAERRRILQKQNLQPLPRRHGLAEGSLTDMKVYIRGNPAKQGETGPAPLLRILSGEKPPPFSHGSGRLELAEAIAARTIRLTARVMVNRIWQYHFGRGLVGHAEQFRQTRRAADASGIARLPRLSLYGSRAGRSRCCTVKSCCRRVYQTEQRA